MDGAFARAGVRLVLPNSVLAVRILMRTIVGISLVLIVIGTLSCRDGGDAAISAERPALRWVRTIDGWEQPSLWNVSPPATIPQLHPLLVAAGQGLASALALVAFGRATDE
jgi:hypothetical protein